jgi:hypothetical protein
VIYGDIYESHLSLSTEQYVVIEDITDLRSEFQNGLILENCLKLAVCRSIN